jgi:CheY-like chemotaxis protein
MRILIVDDNASLRQLLAALFTGAGYEVVATIADGSTKIEEAIELTRPDVICLDYNLPGRDGISILRSVQAIAPQIDVLLMSAANDIDLEQRAADAGASGFIHKPFSQAQVLRELATVRETRQHAAPVMPAPLGTGSAHRDGHVGRRGKAVIADDSGSVRLVLKGLLEEFGLQVVQTVANGTDAVTAARNHLPRVLCLDVNMPEMSGLEALPLIRESSPTTAVVMVTGCADKAFVELAASQGARGYILKPLRPAHVLEFMERLCK